MKYTVNEIRSLAEAIMRSAGLDRTKAATFADCLLQAELRGISSHGITRLAAYSEKIRNGDINATADPVVVSERPATLSIDGANGPGITVGTFAMERCIEKAAHTGACFAAVNNSSHYSFGGYYAMRAASRGMVGISVCNADAVVAPFGGMEPRLGTNPLSVAVPGGEMPDLVLDMATSIVAKGKVNLAEKLGTSIPEGWIIDKEGNPTTNPADIIGGSLLPFGGVKGYAIGLIIDVLVSSLGGGKPSTEITSFFAGTDPEGFKNVGFFMGAIDIGSFVDIAAFHARVDALFRTIKSCAPAPNFDEVMIPGEIEHRSTLARTRDGLDLPEPVVRELSEVAERYGIDHPFRDR
ncbi:MAG: Ldh family oxidoreductase [Spirochaetales bacterium]|nr:Ldh family oxidoreductase [Spirochaetales bacterium]